VDASRTEQRRLELLKDRWRQRSEPNPVAAKSSY
jgi:hypothetical protein